MDKKLLAIIISFVLLVILLPVFTNFLLSVDWFSAVVIGEESTWLSFYGSYLGGIVGGLLTLVGVVMTIRYQDRIKQQDTDEKNKRGIKIIDNLINKAVVSIYFVRVAVMNESLSQTDFLIILDNHSKDLKNVVKEMEILSWETIPQSCLQDFIAIKEHIIAINDVFSKTLTQHHNKSIKNKVEISESTLLYILNMILSKHINITEDKTMVELFQKELILESSEVSESKI